MTALLEYLVLLLSDIGQAKTYLQKGFPETLGNPSSVHPCNNICALSLNIHYKIQLMDLQDCYHIHAGLMFGILFEE